MEIHKVTSSSVPRDGERFQDPRSPLPASLGTRCSGEGCWLAAAGRQRSVRTVLGDTEQLPLGLAPLWQP